MSKWKVFFYILTVRSRGHGKAQIENVQSDLCNKTVVVLCTLV